MHTIYPPVHSWPQTKMSVNTYSILLSKMGAQIVDGAEKHLIVKQADSTKPTETFSPGEYAILTNSICVQVEAEGGTGDIVPQGRSSNPSGEVTEQHFYPSQQFYMKTALIADCEFFS